MFIPESTIILFSRSLDAYSSVDHGNFFLSLSLSLFLRQYFRAETVLELTLYTKLALNS